MPRGYNAMSSRITALGVALFLAMLTTSFSTHAGELIMVEQENCHWCDKWDEEVGTTYNSTPVGRIAPLRRVDIGNPSPVDLAHINLGRATPVFILMEDGAEIGRVRGYPGRDTFWMLLQEQLTKLPSLKQQGAPPELKKTRYSSSRNNSLCVRPLYDVR